MKTFLPVLLLISMFTAVSCTKEDANTELGGNTDILLTKVDSVSGVYVTYEGSNIGSTEMKVVSNIKGEVTYTVTMDLNSIPNDLKIKALDLIPKLSQYYKLGPLTVMPDNKVKMDFTLKITSEGYLDYFTDGKPWTMIKYEDGVGTQYSILNNKGQTVTKTITEKTGIDEWPFAFFNIKTTLVEHVTPSDHPVFNKISYRMNHRFGLVYIELELKDGAKVGIDIIAFFA
ncbi:MAG: hypothetical protein WAT79_13925 [Saprospiraceae bacterium]